MLHYSSQVWVFTWNNYTLKDEQKLQNSSYRYLLYGREVGKKTKTPHLQGVIVFKKKLKGTEIVKIYGNKAHWEPCKSLDASKNYCKKEGNFFEKQKFKSTLKKKKSRVLDPDRPLFHAFLRSLPCLDIASIS